MYSISQLSEFFQVSTRTIRYYEELGLLNPERDKSGRRIFSNKDLTRLKLIFRGKRFGFQLAEIKEMIYLFDQDRTGKKQLERTIEFGNEKLKEVKGLIGELTDIKEEMEQMLSDFERRLSETGESSL
ncbi:MerR family transcriptional regulator [Bacillus sp. M6-12]|uniref:MerR family transcriptional regulator n=1 Tax=Bacillus sp. M6-12 TaxID=2054166 RepID=UPI000C77478B|nr:MerR family DNA-binding transcriptional regulator [Bacillus sp. M6-12]PLS15713.1 MerR family transcriptional regulator [Bacillus sp. M6-12]